MTPTQLVGLLVPEMAVLIALNSCKGSGIGENLTRNRLFVYIHRLIHLYSFVLSIIGCIITLTPDFSIIWPE